MSLDVGIPPKVKMEVEVVSERDRNATAIRSPVVNTRR